MKFKKNFKKGFTLVELIVVIAIVAILAAVSVVSYIAFINSANESADIQLVKQLNTCLQADEALHGKKDWSEDYPGLTSLLESNGFIIENLTKTKSGCDMVYQSKTDDEKIINRYALLKGDDVIYSESTFASGNNHRNFWIPETAEEAKDLSEEGKGVVLGSEIGEVALFEAHSSVIVNGAKVDEIQYSNNDASQKVVIHTNSASTTLTINAENDTVNHYGSVGRVDAEQIDMNCYNEYGKAAYVKLSEGKVVAKAGGKISVVFATNSDASKVRVINEQGTIEAGYTTTADIDTANQAAGGIKLNYIVNDQPVTEQIVNTYAEAAIEVNLIEEIENSGLYEARIGVVGYETLESCVDAVQKGQTIVLLKDITKDANYRTPTWNKGFNVDFNGHSFTTVYDGNPSWYTGSILFADVQNGTSDDFSATISNAVIYSNKGAGLYVGAGQSNCGVTLTVENCTINQQFMAQSGDGAYFAALRITEGGTMIVNSGNYKGYHSIEMGSNATATNKMTVNGGTFDGRVRVGKASTLTINGGTFVNFVVVSDSSSNGSGISINAGTFDADPSSYVAAGHHATNNGDGTWTVSAD